MRSGNSPGDQAPSPTERSFIEAARRGQIIDAAIQVIAEAGFGKASFSRIAKRAGVSPSLISYHFDDRADLIRSVLTTVNSEIDAALAASTADAESYREVLRGLVTGLFRFAAARPERMNALRQIAVATAADPEPADLPMGDVAVGEWEGFLREGQEAGEFRPFDTRVMALGIQGLLERMPGELLRREGARDPEALSAEVYDNLARMVLVDPSTEE
ncbi:TetR family transcriptional regulator [Stackebrandtia albiflava]|uniref:TetR family transcriptional regulator n=1 Tax=Stackebrandtia albiflava TaxID=406432 RepID=A0A562V3E6_9ACTN|nr:TetR/AcrR family transcriptional regulator [Stackebrandtia albiflava]TWJ12404.1 TetR family transcriptional regulator [Stackebrandtia albiflava]